MNKKTILWIGVIGVSAYGIWWMVKNMHVTPREKAILEIQADKFKGFEDTFLKAWADAKKKMMDEFSYNGKTYFTKTGTAKK
jgi:hypothetical protein